MFVTNCTVDTSETLKYPLRQGPKKGGNNKSKKKAAKKQAMVALKQKTKQQHPRMGEEGVLKEPTREQRDCEDIQMDATDNSLDADAAQVTSGAATMQMDKVHDEQKNSASKNSAAVTKTSAQKAVNIDDNCDTVTATDAMNMDQIVSNVKTTAIQSSMSNPQNACEKITLSPQKMDRSTHDSFALSGSETVINGAERGDDDTRSDFECYHPVKCTECSTVVGVLDDDQIVHFFNVLASY